MLWRSIWKFKKLLNFFKVRLIKKIVVLWIKLRIEKSEARKKNIVIFFLQISVKYRFFWPFRFFFGRYSIRLNFWNNLSAPDYMVQLILKRPWLVCYLRKFLKPKFAKTKIENRINFNMGRSHGLSFNFFHLKQLAIGERSTLIKLLHLLIKSFFLTFFNSDRFVNGIYPSLILYQFRAVFKSPFFVHLI